MSKNCCISGKQCSPLSDTTICSIWSGFALYAQACLSDYLGQIGYFKHSDRHASCLFSHFKAPDLLISTLFFSVSRGWLLTIYMYKLHQVTRVFEDEWRNSQFDHYFSIYHYNKKQCIKSIWENDQILTSVHIIWTYIYIKTSSWYVSRGLLNPCSAEPGYTLFLQTV